MLTQTEQCPKRTDMPNTVTSSTLCNTLTAHHTAVQILRGFRSSQRHPRHLFLAPRGASVGRLGAEPQSSVHVGA